MRRRKSSPSTTHAGAPPARLAPTSFDALAWPVDAPACVVLGDNCAASRFPLPKLGVRAGPRAPLRLFGWIVKGITNF